MPEQNVWASQSLSNLFVLGSRRLDVTEHAFPREENSEATASAESVGSRKTRKRALEMYMSEIL
jgi:hypothetical protein